MPLSWFCHEAAHFLSDILGLPQNFQHAMQPYESEHKPVFIQIFNLHSMFAFLLQSLNEAVILVANLNEKHW